MPSVNLASVLRAASTERALEIQSVIFPKSHWDSEDDCREWLRDHDLGDTDVENTETTFQFRQRDPSDFAELRTISLSPGHTEPGSDARQIMAIGGSPVDEAQERDTNLSPMAARANEVELVSPLRVLRRVSLADNEELLALASKAAHDPAIFETNPPEFIPLEASSNRIDSYYTHMDPKTTLRNFVKDMTIDPVTGDGGVPFLEGHNYRMLGFGRSLTGERKTAKAGEVTVRGTFYVLRGMELPGTTFGSTDGWLKAVDAGLVPDVSQSFMPGWWRCDLCERNYFSWDCGHIAGFYYDDENNPVLDRQPTKSDRLATATVVDAHMIEVSTVFAGATPGAGLLRIKAEQEVEAGRMRIDLARMLEARFRIRPPERIRQYPGASPARLERHMPEAIPQENQEQTQTVTLDRDAILAEYRTALGFDAALDDSAVRAELARLRKLAEYGEQARKQLIDEAVTAGKRARGEGFAEETYRAVLADADLATIMTMRDDWKAAGDAIFAGGRATVENTKEVTAGDGEPAAVNGSVGGYPDSAYRA